MVISKMVASADVKADSDRLYTAIVIVSPGEDDGEIKNQDRAFFSKDNCAKRQMAIVCDGVSQSPDSAEAAEYISRNVCLLYEEGGFKQVVTELLQKREALMEAPVKLDHLDSPPLRSIFEDIVRKKRGRSHQTTFVSVCLAADNSDSPNRLRIRMLNCGDSALFVFTADGELRYNNLGLNDENDPFEHASFITMALPDSYCENSDNIKSYCQTFPYGIQLLLCTDGFYDSFNTFGEIFTWLNDNRVQLPQQSHSTQAEACGPKSGEVKREPVIEELHSRLSNRKGDDDISFIWLFPPEPLDKSEEAIERQENPDSSRAFPKKREIYHKALHFIFHKMLRFLQLANLPIL